jgi:apolipoprotein N-acyltransferase
LVFAQRRRNVLDGVAAFIGGAAITFVALAMNPWIWLPLTQYPVAVVWALGIWPLSVIAWIALRVAGRTRPVT